MKTTIEIPDELFRQAKVKAAEEGTTLKEILVTALQNHLFGAADLALVAEEASSTYGSHSTVDAFGWPVLNRAKGDKTVITEDFVNDLREELGV